MVTKVCTGCGEDKALSAFSKNRSMKNGLNARCRVCMSKANAEFYKRKVSGVLQLDKRVKKTEGDRYGRLPVEVVQDDNTGWDCDKAQSFCLGEWR